MIKWKAINWSWTSLSYPASKQNPGGVFFFFLQNKTDEVSNTPSTSCLVTYQSHRDNERWAGSIISLCAVLTLLPEVITPNGVSVLLLSDIECFDMYYGTVELAAYERCVSTSSFRLCANMLTCGFLLQAVTNIIGFCVCICMNAWLCHSVCLCNWTFSQHLPNFHSIFSPNISCSCKGYLYKG